MRRRSRAAGGMVWRAFSDLSNGTVQSGMLLVFFLRRSDCSNQCKLSEATEVSYIPSDDSAGECFPGVLSDCTSA